MQSSSVARGLGKRRATTEMQIKKITTFSALLRQSFALESTTKLRYLKHLLNIHSRGLICQNSKISKNFKKWPKIIKFDCLFEIAECRFHEKVFYKLENRGEGVIQCLLITNHFSQISFIEPPSLPLIFFF